MKRVKKLVPVQLLLMLLDCVTVTAAGGLALLTRFDFSFAQVPAEFLEPWFRMLPAQLLITLAVFWLRRMYHYLWRYVSVHDVAEMALSVFLAYGASLIPVVLLGIRQPRSVLFLGLVYQLLGLVGIRQLPAVKPLRIGVALRQPGQDGVHTSRIPGLVTSTKGTLLALYDAAEDAVSSAPDNLLNARSQSLKHSAQQLLQTRLKVLTPEFTQIGTTTLAAWAALPADPYSAGRYLQALSEEELRAGLTAVSAENALSIPWWHHFTARATALLGTASEAAPSEVSSALLNALQAFPLVRQSDGATLTPERVAVLAQLLAQTDLSAYLLPPKEQPPQPTSSREQILALLQGQTAAPTPDLTQQHFESWLKTETKLLQLLTNKEQPLTAEITLPSASKQQELVAAHNQRSTLALMRYLEANSGRSPGRRVSSASSQEQKLLTLQVSATQP